MAMTMSDLYQNDELVKEVKNEYLERKGNEVYVAMVPDGPPPVNDN
jgi:aminobenzoyl-glutamate utilization protein B